MKYNKFLGWIIIVGIVVRVYFIFLSDYVSPDGVQYIRLGYHLWHDGAFSSGGAMFPDIIQPPLFPFLSGFFSLALPMLLAGKIASLLAGVFLIVVVHRFLLQVANPAQAMIGAALTAAHPGLIAVSSQAVTEAWYLLFVALMIYDGWFFIRQTNYYLGLRTGLWIVLGFLIRPEMLPVGAFFIVAMVFIVVAGKKAKIALRGFVVLLPAVVGILLYAGFVSANLGYFSLSPKINFIRIQSKLAGIAKSENPNIGGMAPKVATYRAFYPLTPDGKELMSRALLYKEPLAMRWLDGHRHQSRKFNPTSLLWVVAMNGKNMLYKIGVGMGLPAIYALLALIGLGALFKKERRMAFYLTWMCLPLGMYLFVHVEDRFLLGSWPMLVGPAALSIDWLYRKGKQWFSVSVTSISVLLLILISTSMAYQKMYRGFRATDRWQAVAGEIEKNVPKDAIVIAKQPQTIFFMNANYRALPFASVPKLLVYSQQQEASYLLIAETDLKLNPYLKEIILKPASFSLELLLKKKLSGETYWLFHFKRKEGNHAAKNQHIFTGH